MQRIGKQQQRRGNSTVFGSEHGRLPSAVGMPTEIHTPSDSFAHRANSQTQTLAVPRRIARPRRTTGSLLAKRQVTPEHADAKPRELFRNRCQQRRAAVRTGSMGQHNGVFAIAGMK